MKDTSTAEPEAARLVVLGLGSVIQSDDGVGVHALRELARERASFPGVEFVEGGTMGLELISYVSGASRLLVLDAVEVAAPPGTLVRLAGDDLRRLPGSGSAHELALADLLLALRLLGQDPPEVILLGIQPGATSLGTSLSAGVAHALAGLLAAARAELLRWRAAAPAGSLEPALPVGE